MRRLAAENSINLRRGGLGRPLSALTKYDLLSAIASRSAGKPVVVPPRVAPTSAPVAAPAAQKQQAAPVASPPPLAAPPKPAAAPTPGPAKLQAGEEFVAHNRMRQLVARNTTQAAFSIPHVTTMWDVNMVAVLEHRKAHKAEFAAAGVNLTVTAYLIQAILAGLKAVPAAKLDLDRRRADHQARLPHRHGGGPARGLVWRWRPDRTGHQECRRSEPARRGACGQRCGRAGAQESTARG
ncbi:MAG: 2-oxo acid dehydrogenase subunit E2 [Anaerolineae bacterium]|nr:2-oxo acid dehydrogenase subunit E2 [Anaerolineae bacterium]